jgi:ABC-type spermidine/putrescine transport system permease subunit II
MTTTDKMDPIAAEYAALPFYKQGWFFQTLILVALFTPGAFPLVIVGVAVAVLWNQTTHVRSRALFGGAISKVTTGYKVKATLVAVGLLVALAMVQQAALEDAGRRQALHNYLRYGD